jgi:hypothetical protein
MDLSGDPHLDLLSKYSRVEKNDKFSRKYDTAAPRMKY